ncbi:MAG: YjbQ family protein [Candidatus Hydrogenedentes bacterium]|jgi:secondary thiamine-phosphate synthase enzyme|nr:YjbQ family protein [Candidatus Hydrogenedentota bacterium]
MIKFSVNTAQHSEFVNIDSQVNQLLRETGLENGLLQLYVPHTTAGITVNENTDPGVPHDILLALDKVIPWQSEAYRHNEGNSAAHVKASLMGSGLTLIIKNGRPQLGTWQSVFFCEFDGPRNRTVWALPVPEQ